MIKFLSHRIYKVHNSLKYFFPDYFIELSIMLELDIQLALR